MSASQDASLLEQSSTDSVAPGYGPRPLLALFYILAVLALYAATAQSIYTVWQGSETFAHGFLIVPIVLWLVWRRRQLLAGIPTSTAYLALVPLLLSGLLWLLATLANVQVIQQIGLVLVLVCGIWLILGHDMTRELAFPLGFLFFAVPIGAGLIPVMMEFTADFTIFMLELSGIPVYREGLYFSIPSGNWSVVEACSGVRYLIASVTLGTLYAYLSYSSLSKRLLFILVSIIVPVVANGIRAYLIVMIGHWSNLKLATGVDHLIYGWVFFGVVMLLLFSLGSRWRDPEEDLSGSRALSETRKSAAQVTLLSGVAALFIALLAAAMWPVASHSMRPVTAEYAGEIELPSLPAGWSDFEKGSWHWQPVSTGMDAQLVALHQNDGIRVAAFLDLYWTQRQGSEVIHMGNQLVHSDNEHWVVAQRSQSHAKFAGETRPVEEALLKAGRLRLLVWQWYRVGDAHIGDPYTAKLQEVFGRLTLSRPDASRIILATVVEESPELAAEVLQGYVDEMWPTLESALDRAAGVRE